MPPASNRAYEATEARISPVRHPGQGVTPSTRARFLAELGRGPPFACGVVPHRQSKALRAMKLRHCSHHPPAGRHKPQSVTLAPKTGKRLL